MSTYKKYNPEIYVKTLVIISELFFINDFAIVEGKNINVILIEVRIYAVSIIIAAKILSLLPSFSLSLIIETANITSSTIKVVTMIFIFF